jgi:hypothetical protein
MTDSQVYFLRPVGQSGPIKIGVSKHPITRLTHYLAWSPVPLEIVATIAGDGELERRFHNAFAHLHSHHEWFRADSDLSEMIERIRGGQFDISALPAPRSLYAGRRRPKATVDAIRMARALYKFRRQGVEIPPAVAAATHTYDCSPAETAARRAIVAAFVIDQRAA